MDCVARCSHCNLHRKLRRLDSGRGMLSLMPNSAPEWQARRLGWRSRVHLAACPLQAILAVHADDRLPVTVAVRESSILGWCLSQPSGEPLESKLSEADDGRPVTARARRFVALSCVSARTRDWHTLIPAYTTTTPT
jgi:hypothetical protein